MKRHTLTAANSSLYHFEGNLKEINNEEGEYIGCFPAILIKLVLDGKEYVNATFVAFGYAAETEADEFLERIAARGSVNLEKWYAIPERSFEEKYLESMAEAERNEREAEGDR